MEKKTIQIIMIIFFLISICIFVFNNPLLSKVEGRYSNIAVNGTIEGIFYPPPEVKQYSGFIEEAKYNGIATLQNYTTNSLDVNLKYCNFNGTLAGFVKYSEFKGHIEGTLKDCQIKGTYTEEEFVKKYWHMKYIRILGIIFCILGIIYNGFQLIKKNN